MRRRRAQSFAAAALCVLRRRERDSLARRRFWTFPVACACVCCSIGEERCVSCVLVVWRGHICFARMQCVLLVNCHGFRIVLSSRAATLEMLCIVERMRE